MFTAIGEKPASTTTTKKKVYWTVGEKVEGEEYKEEEKCLVMT